MVAPAGDRAAAFLIDLLVIVLATILVWVLAGFSFAAGMGNLGLSFALLAGFLLWNFYFIWFEVHRGGMTFGKRGWVCGSSLATAAR